MSDDAPKGPTSSAVRKRLAEGACVGDHLIVRSVLGEGSTAIVYEAFHTRLQCAVALKVVTVEAGQLGLARARFAHEMRVCAALHDPHVPQIYDLGELADGTPYAVMEKVSGSTLETTLQRGELAISAAVSIAEDLLRGLETIHDRGVIHRDIKPANLILQPGADGTLRVRLMDFGVSKLVADAGRAGHWNADPTLTQHGSLVGTPHYMAIEQIVGPNVDARADIYAAGAVLYEMLAGRTLFEGRTASEVVAAVLHDQPVPLRWLRADVPPSLEAVVCRATERNRDLRFGSARSMREALRFAWPVRPPPRPPHLVPAAALALLVCLLVLGAALLWPAKNEAITEERAAPASAEPGLPPSPAAHDPAASPPSPSVPARAHPPAPATPAPFVERPSALRPSPPRTPGGRSWGAPPTRGTNTQEKPAPSPRSDAPYEAAPQPSVPELPRELPANPY